MTPPGSKIIKELNDYFELAEIAQREERFEEAKVLYKKIIEEEKRIREQAEDYARNRFEREKKLKSYDELAWIYYKEGRVVEARKLWEEMADEKREEM